ncbi:MAG: PDZ domain-containing protein, partial [Planctomycetota bacterium]
YYEDYVIAKVNGTSIHSMRDLITAFERNKGEHHRIVLEGYGQELILSRKGLEARGATILEKYGVPADRSPDLKKE